MSEIRVTIDRLPDQREERTVTTGTTVGQLFAEIFAGDRSNIAGRLRAAEGAGVLVDLDRPLADGDVLEPVAIDSADGRAILRHSTAHVMAQAVQEIFPEAKLGIGPPIKDGFYYDFQVERPFTPEDLKAIEQRMQAIVKQGQRFSRRAVSDEAARQELAGEPFKLELIGLKGAGSEVSSDDGANVEVGGGELTIYDNLDPKTGELCWKDLCRGPHLPTTRNIPAFKLMRSAAAYWRGSEKNPQLQRIYGTAWESRDALKAHLEFLAEAEKRDHRKLGAELDLFSFPTEIGSGLAGVPPQGRRSSATRWSTTRGSGTSRPATSSSTPRTPRRARSSRSPGTWTGTRDGMYPPMQLDEGVDYYLKPMNCPMHNLIFRARGRSYRELPLRLFEFGTVYRYEKSGVVHGLTRARGFTQDDAHIYCTREQMADELDSPADLRARPAARLRPERLLPRALHPGPGEVGRHRRGLGGGHRDAAAGRRRSATWSWCTTRAAPRSTARRSPCRPRTRSAAPGRCPRSSSTSTCRSASSLEYQGRRRRRPPAGDDPPRAVRLDRALLRGAARALRRRLPGLAGPGAGRRDPDHRRSTCPTCATWPRSCAREGIRVEVDASDDRMQKKIRNAQKAKVPFMLLAGDEDVTKGAVSFRYRDGSQKNGVPVDEAVAEIVEAVRSRRND